MNNDTIMFDSIEARPLPQWLTDQRDGLNYYQPEILVMKEDHTLDRTIIYTGIVLSIIIILLTIFIVRKYKIKL